MRPFGCQGPLFSSLKLRPQETRVLKILLFLSALGEWLGPAVDLILYFFGKSERAFYPTSFWNILFSFILLLTAILFHKGFFRGATRFLVYASLLLGPLAIHNLGGVLSPVPFYLLFPLLLGGYLLSVGENALLSGIAWVEILALILWERTHPPPTLAQDPTLYFGAYVLMGMAGILVLSNLIFYVYRGTLRNLSSREGELEKLYLEVQHQAEELERALEVRKRFLENVSHELRTPLASIIGSVEILYREKGKDPGDSLRILHSASVHLLRLVENLLDISRIESGGLELRFRSFNPRRMLEEVKSLGEALLSPRCSLKLYLEHLPPRVISDEEKIRRIVLNLLSNAIKATQEGMITIRGFYEGGLFKILIEDTGTGFDPEAVLSGRPRKGNGLGIGLQISRKLVEVLKGELRIESRIGAGTRALVAIPVTVEEGIGREELEELLHPSYPLRQRPCRILIVDDHPEILDVFRLHCELCGYEAFTALTVAEGLEILKNQGPFSLILLDLLMPEVDGYQGLRIYRQYLAEKNIPAKILALTAHVTGDDEVRLLKEGFDGFIPKPISYEEFARKLREALKGVL